MAHQVAKLVEALQYCMKIRYTQWVVNNKSACIGCKHYLPKNIVVVAYGYESNERKRRVPPTRLTHSAVESSCAQENVSVSLFLYIPHTRFDLFR